MTIYFYLNAVQNRLLVIKRGGTAVYFFINQSSRSRITSRGDKLISILSISTNQPDLFAVLENKFIRDVLSNQFVHIVQVPVAMGK